MNKTSKIFVAGHRGLVGSAILRKLESDGYKNIVVRTHKQLDLSRQEAVEMFFREVKPSYVFLAAAMVGGIIANNTSPADFIYDNLIIEANIIRSAYLYNVKKLLFLGSSCIYPKFAPQPMKEEHLLTGDLEPTNEPYAVAKIAGIKMCQAYNRQYGTHFISVMPTNLFGTGDNFNLETAHVLPALIRKFHLGKLLQEKKTGEIEEDLRRFPVGFSLDARTDSHLTLKKLGVTSEYITLWGSGNVYREFLFVDDLADACEFLMQNYDSGEIINIGTGRDIRITELAELVREITGFRGEIRWDTSKPDGTPKKLLDVSKLNSLGWSASTSLREGIKKTYDWYIGSSSK
jgi:GDP-L-fucose synthase